MKLRRSPTLEIGEKIKAASLDNKKLWSLSTPNLPSYNVLPHNPEHIESSPPTNIIFEWYIWDLPPTGAKGFGQTLMPPDWVLP